MSKMQVKGETHPSAAQDSQVTLDDRDGGDDDVAVDLSNLPPPQRLGLRSFFKHAIESNKITEIKALSFGAFALPSYVEVAAERCRDLESLSLAFEYSDDLVQVLRMLQWKAPESLTELTLNLDGMRGFARLERDRVLLPRSLEKVRIVGDLRYNKRAIVEMVERSEWVEDARYK